MIDKSGLSDNIFEDDNAPRRRRKKLSIVDSEELSELSPSSAPVFEETPETSPTVTVPQPIAPVAAPTGRTGNLATEAESGRRRRRRRVALEDTVDEAAEEVANENIVESEISDSHDAEEPVVAVTEESEAPVQEETPASPQNAGYGFRRKKAEDEPAPAEEPPTQAEETPASDGYGFRRRREFTPTGETSPAAEPQQTPAHPTYSFRGKSQETPTQSGESETPQSEETTGGYGFAGKGGYGFKRRFRG